jgi:hypothetical protein
MGRQGLLEPARWASPGFRIATGDPGAEVSFGQPPADREGKSHAVALTRVCEPALQRPRPLPPASCRTTCRGNQSPERASAAFGTMRVGPAPFPAIEQVCRRRSSTGVRSRFAFAQSRPVAGASKVPQSAAKPEVSELSGRDDAIHHLRVRKYARRNALATDRLGDASQ